LSFKVSILTVNNYINLTPQLTKKPPDIISWRLFGLRRTAVQIGIPQVLPVLQAAALLNEAELLPSPLDANREIFFLTSTLLHSGQVTLPAPLELKTSSSNSWPQVSQIYSKIGIFTPGINLPIN
jgi:hypothetical protein